MNALKPLRSANYRRLFFSTATSATGDWLDFVAVLVLVTVVWRHGATGLAVVGVSIAAPQLLAPLVGVLVDRRSPRVVMVTADIARGVLTAAMFLSPNLAFLAILLALRSLSATAFLPAQQRALKAAVPQENLLAANALTQTMVQTVKIVGPAVGGLFIAFVEPRNIILVNALTYFLSALILIGLVIPRPQRVEGPSGYLRELVEGVRFVGRTSALRMVVAVLAVTVFMVFLYDAMTPLAVRALGLDPSYIGYLVAAVGFGGVVGAVVVGQWGDRFRPFLIIAAAQVIVGAVVVVLGVSIAASLRAPGAVWLGAVFLIGVASAGVLVPYPYIVQSSTPDHLLGRVWTATAVVPTILQVLAPMVAAALVPLIGLGPLFAIAGAGLLVIAVVTAIRQRGLDIGPAEPPVPDQAVPDQAVPESAEPAATVVGQPAAPAGEAMTDR
ncbi:MFS transporter [Micromonospora sp. Llam7]|uniref:MFS transporter n=1 Tax=Micromonospora tarapacensis TaxID=2835305 RepID=UPI001C83D136|nr:MFS transporter [Micromonospora tarapacensis]MBX7265715.1 MFS transporter [Micromonospora tarapacensis]